MSDKPTSFHDFKWGCGHTGPGYCKICHDERIEADRVALELLQRKAKEARISLEHGEWDNAKEELDDALRGFAGDTLPDHCEWREDEEYDCMTWDSDCGEKWCFTEGGPAENRVTFCHGCGKRIRVIPLTVPNEIEGKETP